jgi:hypothetical protein
MRTKVRLQTICKRFDDIPRRYKSSRAQSNDKSEREFNEPDKGLIGGGLKTNK